jgi:hypothetical protein
MQNKIDDKSYPFKHWASTLILVPIAFICINYYKEIYNPIHLFQFYFLFLIFGFLFSTPTFFLYYFTYQFLKQKRLSIFLLKLILNTFSVLCVFATIKFIGGTMMTIILAIYYSIGLILSSLFIKIKQEN